MYVGEHLPPLFRGGPTALLLRDLTETGGELLKDWITRNTPIKFGTLRGSWYRTPVSRSSQGVLLAAAKSYITWVRTEVDYAPMVEWGTGLWGPHASRYPIPGGWSGPRPMPPGRWMTWIGAGGQRHFAKLVSHPGSPGAHMVAIGAAMTEHTFEAAAQPRLRQWVWEQEAEAKIPSARFGLTL